MIELNSVINNDGEVFSFGHFEGVLTSSDGKQIESYGARDYFLIKFFENGKVDWMYNIGGSQNDFITGDIAINQSGDIFITGAFQGYLKYTSTDSIPSSGSFDTFIIKINNEGEIIWTRNIGRRFSFQMPTTIDIIDYGEILLALIHI